MSEFRRVVLAVLAVCAAACGPSSGSAPSVDAAPPPHALLDGALVSGRYAVEGITVQAVSGRQREISGTMQLDVDGALYEVSFDLETTAPVSTGPVPVIVRGTGRGFVVGETLVGTTQERMTLVPPDGGLDALDLRAELPVGAGIEIVSRSRASFEDDGRFEIVLDNYPAKDPRYEPSMTVLSGRLAKASPASR